MNAEALKKFVATYTEDVWNGHRVDAMDKYYASSYAHHDVSRPDVQTLADYKQWARDLIAAFSSLRVNADALLAENGMAVKRWTATGVHTGTLAGIPPTDRRVQFSGVSIYRFDADRIVESWYVYDLFGLIQQMTAPVAAAASLSTHDHSPQSSA
jgi:steroid delta-isomerase-like uncharacterized protein